MHPNPTFRKIPAERNLEFARARGFGVLSVNGADGPVMAHVPFLLSADGSHADLHLARSNAIFAAGLPARAVLAVVGPDAYVSPDWYGVTDQVPTWNYIAVHLRGELVTMPPDALEPHVNALSDEFEARLAPKPVWKSSKMTEGVMERMMRMILPVRLKITAVEGTWKLNQNKTAEARNGVISAFEAQGGAATEIARAMRDLSDL
ncbi:FMN-binding negative transcriptional regulator [bacterium]|nr:FMN-binding negative transcriptional regulator [bacterium]